MWRMNKPLLLVFFFFTSLLKVNAQAFVFAQLTGSPVNTTGWNLTGNAYVGNTPIGGGNSEIILTNPANSQSGAIFYSQPINIAQCDRWTVEFDMRMFDGTGADGIAFCLLDVPPSGFVGGGGCGIPAASNGLKIVFDTFDNCGGANPNIQIRYGAGYAGGECNFAQPTLENPGGAISFIRRNPYNHVQIDYLAGNIAVRVNGTLYLTGFYAINFVTYAGFTASTGGANDRQSIKNVFIRTDMAMPVAYSGPNASTCSGQPIQIGSAPDLTYQYNWTPATGLNSTTIGNPTLTLNNPGPNPQTVMYKVGANIIGSPGCVQYDSVYVTVYPIPPATFVTDAPTYCVSQTATITYTGFASPAANYTWNFAGASIISGSGQGPYQVKWNTSGPKNITLTVAENNCTSTQYSQQVTVYDIPTSTFTLQAAACQNAPVTITYTGTATPAATYSWNFGGGTVASGSGQGPYTVSWPNAGNPAVSLSVTENGCTSPVTVNNITINAIPTATFTAQSPVCDQASSQLTYTGTGTPAATYTWNFDSGTATPSGGNENYTVVWPTTGTKNVTLTVTENGCTSPQVTQQVIVYPIPTSTFTLSPSVCAAAQAQASYTGTATPGATYTWNFNGGTATPAGGTENYNVVWPTAGSYSVTLTVTENGCTSTQTTQNITVNPIPTAAFNATSPICDQGASIINYVGTGTGNATYNWNFDTGLATPIIGENYSVTWPATGVKNVTLTVTENGCTSPQVTQQVVVYPIPTADFTATPTICQFDDAAVSYTGNGTGNAAYVWNFDGGTATQTTGENYNVNWPAPGFYTLTLTVTENGCQSTPYVQNVTVNYQPSALFSYVPTVCKDDNLTITYTGSGLPTATYNWSVGGGGTITGSGQGPITANWTTPGSYPITLTVGENGCNSIGTRNVNVVPLPTIMLAPVYNLCIGEELELDPGSFVNYSWSDGYSNRKYPVEVTGTYTVTVTDLNGCINTASTSVVDTVCLSLYIPSAFTPNGDGKNEVFKPVIEYPLSYTMRIYDRWGNLVFQSVNDPNAYWDGTFGGQPGAQDVYIYMVEYKGYENQRLISGSRTGKVTLLR